MRCSGEKNEIFQLISRELIIIIDLVLTVVLPQGSEILLELLSAEDRIFYILISSSS